MIVCITGGDLRFGAPAGAGYCYDLTMDDGNVGAGQTFYISANTLKAAGGTLTSDETLSFDGSAETDGSFTIFAGAGADHVVGGGGADTIYGEGGADQLTGGAGGDTFRYTAATESTLAAKDRILDFSAGDRIDLSAIDAIAGGADDAFHFIGSGPFSHTAGELLAYASGVDWYDAADIDGNGATDFVIAVTTDHALGAGDFVL
jgi:Ca2+-binding RTX toxin-like protein